MRRTSALVVGLIVVVLAGCGGDDTSEPADQPESAAESSSPDQQAATEPTDRPDEPDLPEATTPPPVDTEAADGPAPADTNGLVCDDVFSVAEMTEFIGEPVQLVETTEPSIGQIVCQWETPEDPDNLDDLASGFVLAQIFTGDPIPGESFVDETVFDDVTMIEGMGDLAFWTDEVSPTFYVVDGPLAGVFSYVVIDFGDPNPPATHSIDEQLELFRLFHDRIT